METSEIVPTREDLNVTRLVIAVHGIGSQFRYATVQAVARRFAAYCRAPITQPLGVFHPAKLITDPASPELGAYLFNPPVAYANDFVGFGFAEVFWADIPERAADTKNTTEESKAWAQTLVERVRTLDQSGTGSSDLIDYKKASAVVEEMIGTIKVLENLLFIAKKAGLFEFNLGQLLTDFLGDVQIVADFKDYGGDIFERFAVTMKQLVRRMPNVEKIYIIAHSEGTVVSFKGLTTALAAEKNSDNDWVDKVKGYMTIGSPLNKHIVMWPGLWKGLTPALERRGGDPILWRNYYDYGDPVGFDLEITREWMKQNAWQSCFQFAAKDDCGFTRYPFPGKAHNDYWDDDKVFGNFIDDVVCGNRNAEKPRTILWTLFVSRVVPYVLCLVLLAGGTYVLYSTLVATFFKSNSDLVRVIRNVSGISSLLAGVTVFSRMPRLDKIWPGSFFGVVALALGIYGYLAFATPRTQELLSGAFWIPNGIIFAFLIIGLISAGLGKLKPEWGMTPLIGLGGIAACLVLLTLLQNNPTALDRSLWALILANAAFLYLWWLSALIFDLVYIWHRFICSYKTTAILSTLRAEAPSDSKA
jgi:hypothetical protein